MNPESNIPLISVIMPVYNGESYLAEAIQSVLDQNCDSLEIVAVNDGSTDKSAEIIKGADQDIRYFYQHR